VQGHDIEPHKFAKAPHTTSHHQRAPSCTFVHFQPREPSRITRTPTVNVHGEKRSNDTHQSSTDPEAKLEPTRVDKPDYRAFVSSLMNAPLRCPNR
jgi:hypothetical protein